MPASISEKHATAATIQAMAGNGERGAGAVKDMRHYRRGRRWFATAAVHAAPALPEVAQGLGGRNRVQLRAGCIVDVRAWHSRARPSLPAATGAGVNAAPVIACGWVLNWLPIF
ncbi:hypothetical protein [Xanthomonas campestris]|uniref:hypothetical protein n=1 Tax=Xanthomonas campestris TaxID=339 RepID=UPI001390551D|nr:hypothetical protein [Xanthomonas campestris]WVL62990.1 hypothetical protein LLE68_018840 [Xanthomonas campestris pv. barbareae]